MSRSSSALSSSRLSRVATRVESLLIRLFPSLGYHHLLMGLVAVAIILQSVLVAGCTSESLNGIFIFSLTYTNGEAQRNLNPSQVNPNASYILSSLAGNETSLHIRAGYLGTCLTSGNGWICSRSSEQLATVIIQSKVADPLNLIFVAEKFRSEVVFVGLWFVSIAFSFISFCILWGRNGFKRESLSDDGSERAVTAKRNIVPPVMVIAMCISSMMALLSGFWQHMAGVAASIMTDAFTYGAASGDLGVGAMVLGWVSFFLLAVALLGLTVIVIAIHLLNM
ncbi:unnamed protein product [Clonostachys rosea f. rosea IK726]|uniref:Uncharacterized protein n=1 Tax=Clonostachys rosea f. rosea IK726 TaxID=1349383 RepID=A0ACA9USJ8_BIOOC|nr:unnamed protein product [Clonostachys rosea f. rosea IK726]